MNTTGDGKTHDTFLFEKSSLSSKFSQWGKRGDAINCARNLRGLAEQAAEMGADSAQYTDDNTPEYPA